MPLFLDLQHAFLALPGRPQEEDVPQRRLPAAHIALHPIPARGAQAILPVGLEAGVLRQADRDAEGHQQGEGAAVPEPHHELGLHARVPQRHEGTEVLCQAHQEDQGTQVNTNIPNKFY